MTAGMGTSLMAVAGRVARPVASCGLCIKPVDISTYPRINGRAFGPDLRINGRARTHKRSRL